MPDPTSPPTPPTSDQCAKLGPTEAECGAASGCSWDGSTCGSATAGTTCGAQTSQTGCETYASCVWSGTACGDAPKAPTTDAECAQSGFTEPQCFAAGCEWTGVKCKGLGASDIEITVAPPSEDEDDTLTIILIIALTIVAICLIIACVLFFMAKKKAKYHERNAVNEKDRELQQMNADREGKQKLQEQEEALLTQYKQDLEAKNHEIANKQAEVEQARRDTEAERQTVRERDAELAGQEEKQRQMLESRDADEQLRARELADAVQRDAVTKSMRSGGMASIAPGAAGTTSGMSSVRSPAPTSTAGPMPPSPHGDMSPMQPQATPIRRPPTESLSPSYTKGFDDPVSLSPEGSHLRSVGHAAPHPSVRGSPGALPPAPR